MNLIICIRHIILTRGGNRREDECEIKTVVEGKLKVYPNNTSLFTLLTSLLFTSISAHYGESLFPSIIPLLIFQYWDDYLCINMYEALM